MAIRSESASHFPTSSTTVTTITNEASSKRNQAVPLPFWVHFFSGGIAGSISAVATCPLELVKTRFQSSHYYSEGTKWQFRSHPFRAAFGHVSTTLGALRYVAILIFSSIYLNEGFFSLWKGVGATLVGVMPSRAIYFSSYQTSKSYLSQHFFHGTENASVHIMSAISAGMLVIILTTIGIITTTATNPIWLIKTRIQLQSSPKIYKNSFDCLRQVIRNEGPLTLYQGMTASYLGCIEGTIQWVLYEKLKTFFRKKFEPSSVSENVGGSAGKATFCAAAISKVIACSLTYPHEVLRTRLRQGSFGAPSKNKTPYKGLISTIRRIYVEEGLAPFYGGMTAHLLRVVPNAAIMFFCYEILVHSISHQYGYTTNSSSLEERKLETV